MLQKTSYLDLRCHEFKCEQIACGYTFKEILRRLEAAQDIKCPRCEAAMDIRKALRAGDLRKAIDAARQLDAQPTQQEAARPQKTAEQP
jgi:predicted nucleic acid-binding Zn ribbon protein